MSSYKKYNFEPSEIKKVEYKKPNLKALPTKKTKINYIKIFILLLATCFILKPVSLRIYDYLFLNKLSNAKIQFDANHITNKASNLFANTNLFGRNFIGEVKTNSPEMTPLQLNEEMYRLKSDIQYILNQYPKLKAGIFIFDYETNNYVSINGDKQFSAASIIKVPILLQMFKRIENGYLNLYENFKIASYYRTAGSGYLQYQADGKIFEMNDLATYMIRTSDNSATNMILSAIGGSNEMNIALRNWGFSKTYIKTWLPDLYGTNVTTPKDMATILFNADNPDFLSLENRSRIVEIMSKVKNTSLLKQGIPDSAQLIHKTGDIGGMLGDVGVVTMPNGRRYIITAFVERKWNDYSARNLINSVSATVYNSFATNNL